MISEMILSPERLLTDVTAERPFVRMRSFVDQQIVTLRESSLAVFADKFLLGPRRSSAARAFFQRRRRRDLFDAIVRHRARTNNAANYAPDHATHAANPKPRKVFIRRHRMQRRCIDRQWRRRSGCRHVRCWRGDVMTAISATPAFGQVRFRLLLLLLLLLLLVLVLVLLVLFGKCE